MWRSKLTRPLGFFPLPLNHITPTRYIHFGDGLACANRIERRTLYPTSCVIAVAAEHYPMLYTKAYTSTY